MPGDLSHGLPSLRVSGNRIVHGGTNRPVLLRGVNRSGLEYSEPSPAGFLDSAGLTQDEIRVIVREWGANILRLPFNQDWALHGRSGHSAESYLGALDRVIGWAAALGSYTLLDLQWLDADTAYGHASGKVNRVAPTPNSETSALWSKLAARYRGEPAVLFDLFNEPHDPLADDFLPIWVAGADGNVAPSDAGFVGPEEWNRWAARLVREIRRVHPESLIFVAGVDWAFDLRRVSVDAPNIVYSTHIYPNRPSRSWKKAFGNSAEVPVFVGEWGGGQNDLDFGRDLLAVMRREAAGWTAWSWVDDPPLVEPPRAPAYRPTLFGELVREELRHPLFASSALD